MLPPKQTKRIGTVAQLNALTSVPVGTPGYALDGRAITGVNALGIVGGFLLEGAGAGGGVDVSMHKSGAWKIVGTTQTVSA